MKNFLAAIGLITFWGLFLVLVAWAGLRLELKK